MEVFETVNCYRRVSLTLKFTLKNKQGTFWINKNDYVSEQVENIFDFFWKKYRTSYELSDLIVRDYNSNELI